MDRIKKYFPNIDSESFERLSSLQNLYYEWNQKINFISRKDFNYFNERHLLHSLSIAYMFNFKTGTKILDVGTGGGFPGIPLAIFFPDVEFILIDSIAKKSKVVEAVKEELKLNNVAVVNGRAEDIKQNFDFVVSRAVAPLNVLWSWINKNISRKSLNEIHNGMICLKGGDLTLEISETDLKFKIWNISDIFEEEFFETKKIVHVWK